MRIRTMVSAALAPLLTTAVLAAPAYAIPSPSPSPGAGPRSGSADRLTDPGRALPTGWQHATDRAVTTTGDTDGLHVLTADESTGYRWRTAATLAEPGFDTDQWIGQSCVTGSGQRAVVAYEPREFTNHPDSPAAEAFVAVVDLRTDIVVKTSLRSSLAYFNPGCGTGETAAFATSIGSAPTSTVAELDATTGRVTRSLSEAGQVTSAVPFAGFLAAARGDRLVSIAASGAVRTLRREAGVPFRLHPDSAGGLAYQVPDAQRVQVRRWTGVSRLLGTGQFGRLRVAGSAGHVFVLGADADRVPAVAGWTRLTTGVDAQPSTTGALVVTGAPNAGDRSIHLSAETTATHQAVQFTVPADATHPALGRALSPALHVAASPAAVDPATTSWDPDAGCAVPRNDPNIQTLQATANQVEWATDLAVHNKLLVNRPKNWMGSGMPVAWQPQALFPPHALIGGTAVPAQVMLGILAQESNTMQGSPHLVDGETGNFNQGGFYGDGVNWSTVDCGYGVGQVTTGMAKTDGDSVYNATQRQAIATDYASNIAASLNALIDKWNQLKNAGITVNDGSSAYIENWYLAAWAYNTGIQPSKANGNTNGCTPGPSCTDGTGRWGLGWSNNPANPNYPVDRELFNAQNSNDTKHPNLWPYQEKVMGWAYTPVARYDYSAGNWEPSYLAGTWNNGGGPKIPAFSTFCVVAADSCSPGAATDVNGKSGAGLCQLSNLHCWWHQASTTWTNCVPPSNDLTPCGQEVIGYQAGSAEPANTSVYPPDCTAPTGAVIVDDVTTPSAVPCTKHGWTTSQGQFALHFPSTVPSGCTSNCVTYQGKIDFHQGSTGFGGHLWFAHTGAVSNVTGTWTPPSTTTGWTHIKVHIPQSGATTQQADYRIDLGNGQTRHRVVNQHWNTNTWVDLGVFNLAAGASVSLSNASPNVASTRADGGDIAFDALAFIASSKPVATYVALGDSYSSGESAQPYEGDSANDGVDTCHRSVSQAYSALVHLPGQSMTIAALAANNQAVFHFIACSGAQTVDMTQSSVQTGTTDNTDWNRVENYHQHEVNQIDDSGWLDQDTTLVTLSIGGNDVGFADIVEQCLESIVTNCIDSGFRLNRSHGDHGTAVKDSEALTTYEPYLIGQLRWHLAQTYRQIHLHAPNAEIVVVGYPKLFDLSLGDSCDTLPLNIQSWLDQMADAMKQTITGAVADVKTAYAGLDIRFVDADAGFSQHAVCEPDASNQYLNGVNVINQSSSFHPNHNGQAEYGVLVNAAL